jgi:hypothetical protein
MAKWLNPGSRQAISFGDRQYRNLLLGDLRTGKYKNAKFIAKLKNLTVSNDLLYELNVKIS